MRNPPLVIGLALTIAACVKDPVGASPTASSTPTVDITTQTIANIEREGVHPEPAPFGPWEFDGPCPVGMVLIDGGQFEAQQRERLKKLFAEVPGPDFDAEIAPFCLALCETTMAEYWECTKAELCVAGVAFHANLPFVAECLSKDVPCPQAKRETAMGAASSEAAEEYCRVRGGRLPSLTEWYWAALGGDEDRLYPWGDEPPSETRLNVSDSRYVEHQCDYGDGVVDERCAQEEYPPALDGDDGHLFAAPVDSYPSGAGRWGHFNLLGNVAEYVTLSTRGGWTTKCGRSYRTLKPESLDLHDNVCPISNFDAPGMRCAADPRAVTGAGDDSFAVVGARYARMCHVEDEADVYCLSGVWNDDPPQERPRVYEDSWTLLRVGPEDFFEDTTDPWTSENTEADVGADDD